MAFSGMMDFYKSVGKVSTLGGLLFGPFLLASAGAALASGASVGGLVTSFYNPLVTGTTGEMGIMPVAEKMWDGAVGISKSAFNLAAAGVNPGPEGVWSSVKAMWGTPANSLSFT